MPKCLHCGEYHLGRSNSKYCSDTCRYEARYVERNCKECGEEVTGTKKKLFCCPECRIKFFNKKKLKNLPILHTNCKWCNTPIESKIHKIYCSKECRCNYAEAKLRAERKVLNDKYASSVIFEEFELRDIDSIDIIVKDLNVMKHDNIKLKEHMSKYGIKPRLVKTKINTLRGSWNIKVNVVNTEELIKLYNIKVDKFRTYPTLGIKNTILDLAKLIKKARSIVCS